MTLGPVGGSILSWISDTWQPNGGQVVEEIGAVVATSKGLVRSENRDRCLIVRSRVQGFVCFVVCDGIGGLANGGRAAEIAVSRFVESLVDDPTADLKARLVHATEAANAEVHGRYSEKGGTTLAAVLLDRNNRHYGVTAGDTRIYALKGRTRVEQISSDDTIAGELQRIKGVNVPQEDVGRAARQLAQIHRHGSGNSAPYLRFHIRRPGWLAAVKRAVGNHLLHGRHRALVSDTGGINHRLLSKPGQVVKLTAGDRYIQIAYDGLMFRVQDSSDGVFINNVPCRVGVTMPESCVVTIGTDSSRVFYLFDVSHPEVVL